VSSVLISGKVLAFRSRRYRGPQIGPVLPGWGGMTRDVGDSGDSCSPLPMSLSQTPTPHRTFVENKHQSAIRPSGHRAVEALFSRFSGLQSRSISAVFPRSSCPVGRGSWARLLGFPANCQLLIANCFLSKSFLGTSHPEALPEYTSFLRPNQ